MAKRSFDIDEDLLLQTKVSKNAVNSSKSTGGVYVFDMDGTLLDSNHIAKLALYNLAEENGFEFNDGLVTKIIPLGFDGGTRFYMEHFGLKGDFEEEKDIGGDDKNITLPDLNFAVVDDVVAAALVDIVDLHIFMPVQRGILAVQRILAPILSASLVAIMELHP